MTENFDCPHCGQDLRLDPDARDELLQLRQRVKTTSKLLDRAGVEHSGRTLEERVSELIQDRDDVRKLLIRTKALGKEKV